MKNFTFLKGAIAGIVLTSIGFTGYSQVFTVGSGTSTTTSTLDSPYGTFYMDDRTQLLYTAAEINAAGGYAGSISAFAMNTSSTASMAMGNFTIKIGTTTATSIAGGYSTATLTEVYSVSSFTTVVGWQEFTFNTPFNWNGTDNIIIDVCFDNSAWSSPSGGVRADNLYGQVYSRYQDNSGGSICGTNNGGGGAGSYRAQGRFTILPPYPNDAGVASILSPTIPTCDLDSLDLEIVINNLGSDTLHNCSIYYQINTSTPVAMYYTGSVAPQGGTDTLTIGNESFTNGDELTIWTELPNGVPDSLSSNDELSMVTATGLSGNYSIPGDYATINDAADDLHSFGVCGDVVFSLATGTYNEQVTFNDILGTSDSATVTFQSASGNRNDVLIQYDASGSADNYVIQFNGGDWITFKDLRMKALEQYTYGCVLNVKAGSNNNTIENCWLKGNSYQTTSNLTANILWEGSSDGFTLTNSLVENGAQSMYMVSGNTADPSEDMVIQGNIIKNALYYQMYMYAIDGFILDDNTITNDSALYGGNYGYYQLYMYSVNNFDITKNYIGHDVGQGYYYPIYLNSCIGRNNPRSQFSNNCIFQGTPGATSYGYNTIYAPGSGIMDFHNNSITRRGGFGNYAVVYIANGGLISMKNNSIANLTSGYALQVAGGFSITESDYNNLYTASGSPVYYGTSQYSTLEAYQNATGNDMNSVQTDPNFQTSLTCITCNDTLSDAGTPSSATDDIMGNTRSLSTPDIGATEFVNANSFTLGGDDTICGSQVVIEAGPAQSVTWNVNNQTSTQSSVTLTANNEPINFNVSVSISTEYCGNASDNVVIRLIPDAALDSATHICSDESITLNPGGGSNATYMWSTGATTSTVDAGAAGMYSVIKMEEGCESEASIVVTQSTAVDIADIEGCEDDAPISVDATIPDGSSYAWTGGSSTSTAANEFSASGSYSVTATDIHGCVSSADFDLLVLGAPEADITYVGTAGTAFLFSSAGSANTSPNTTYLWTFNGIDTSSAANPTYVFPWNGAPTTYPVSLVIDNGCGQDPAEISITVDPLSINDIDAVDFAVCPNPATSFVNITLGSEVTESGLVEIMDVTGRVLNSKIIGAGQITAAIDISELASGSYLVKVSADNNASVSSIVKQ